MRTHLDYNVVSIIAARIANCDFRVTITQHVAHSDAHKMWIITVGETTWQRHLVVTEFVKGDTRPRLDVLKQIQSGQMIIDVNPHDIDFILPDFEAFIDSGYAGVKKTLATTVAKAA